MDRFRYEKNSNLSTFSGLNSEQAFITSSNGFVMVIPGDPW